MPNETSTKKRLSATVYYLLTGMALGWPGLAATGALLRTWQRGGALTPLSLATLHLLVLGFMLTVAFGVLYQIVPIAFQAPPLPRHVLYWHLPVHVAAVAAMVVGFLSSRFVLVGVGGSVLLCSTIGYFAILLHSYARARNKTPVHKGLMLPFVALGLVIFVGIFQAFAPQLVTQHVLVAHVALGGMAFWGGLVLVFSYKLVPMFAISHGYKASLPRTIAMYYVGVVLWMVAASLPDDTAYRIVSDVGCALVLLSLISYIWDMAAIVRARKKRKIVLPLIDAFLAMAMFVLGQTGVAVSMLARTQAVLYPSLYLFAFGGLIALMYAFMQKIVPFLWFEYRFSKRPERKTAPLIDDMVPKRVAQWGMAVYFIGVIVGFVGMWGNEAQPAWRTLGWLGASCLTVGSVMLFTALRHVLTIGGSRPSDD